MKQTFKPKLALAMLAFVASLLLGLAVSAQVKKPVTGVVKDPSGTPISGATVRVKGAKAGGVITDDAGYFSIKADPNAILVISSIGYENVEMAASQSLMAVQLPKSNKELSQVVVTGFGVKKDVRKLGYSVSSVAGDEIAHTNTPNPINALQGKVPGLYMSGVVGGPQTSSRILLRGITDIRPGANNQPLFVIDGVLIQPDVTKTGAEYGNDQDFGNQLKNLNADDIESISVLKGSAGTALYGSSAQNGVILVTTKKGTSRKGLGVSVTQQYSIEKAYGGADFQNEFGAGANPAYFNSADVTAKTIDNGGNAGASGLVSFGHKFDGTTVTDIDGRSVPWVAHPHNYLDVYRTGSTSNTNVALSGGDENSTFRASWSRLSAKGITPTNDFDRNNFTIRATRKFSSFMDIDAGVTYTIGSTNNPQAQNSSSRTLFNAFVYEVPREYDAKYYNTHYTDPVNGGLNLTESNAYGNAGNGYSLSYFLYKLYYWNNHLNENTLKANVDVNLHFTPWLKFLMRGNLFNTYSTQEQKFWGDGPNFAGNLGLSDDFSNQYRKDKFNYKSYRAQGLLTASKKLNDDLEGSFNVGGEIFNKGTEGEYAHINGLQTPGLFLLSNYADYTKTSFGEYDNTYKYRNVSFYAFGDLGYKDILYLNVSDRLEYSSALVFPNGSGHNSYQYYSVGLSWLLHKTFNLPSYVSFAKLRASLATTGKDIDPWSISKSFNTYSYIGSYSASSASLNQYGFANNQIIDANLKPQRTTDYEVGVDLRFLHDRIGIDASVFSKTTSQQIATQALDNASGAGSLLTNNGKIRNQGLEIGLTLVPVKTRDFSWNSFINYTKYVNKLVDYASTSPYVLEESQYFTEIRSYKGQAYGDIYSNNAFTPYQAFDGAGKPVADPNNGKHVIYNSGGFWRYQPVQYASGNYDHTARKLGNINPDFTWSWSNTFNYKNFFAGFLVDGRVGGKILSFTYKYGTGIGALTSSLHGRDKDHGGVAYSGTDANGIQGNWNDGIIPDGVFGQGQTASVNGATVQLGGMTFADAVSKGYVQPIPASQYYYQAYGSWSRGIADLSTFDDTWVSLREVSVGYNIPKSITDKAKIQNLRLSLVGRNLFYIHNGMPANVNPEGIFNNRASAGFDFGAGPSTRSLGVSLNANF